MTDEKDNNYIAENSRCLHCAKPSCALACPLNNDVPRLLQLASDGKFSEAVQLIGHPFGEICGFVCPEEAHCRGGCVLGRRGQAVNIGEVEREVFKQISYRIERQVRLGSKSDGLKVAIVGGGVSGITCAVKLYEQGADVTLFERNELLSTLKLIPDFRLPREAIDRVLKSIDGLFTVVKRDVNFEDIFVRKHYPWQTKAQRNRIGESLQLTDTYDAVYVAVGASKIYKLGVAGEELATPYDEFLKRRKYSGKVVVIGGGNTAMDCARVAKRSGCDVTVAYRRTREDMPAFGKEIEDAYSDGVKFEYNLAPIRLEKVGDKLSLTLAKTLSEGRDKLTVTDETTTTECDEVVAALGSKFDNENIYGAFIESLLNPQNPYNPRFNLYVGGDALGSSTVVNAVADGMRAAHAILKEYRKSR
ncbi:MAG: FAD-dependent oxidoreductase [Clostridiales bacterium]|nr:FAD-dependent oxidoreductase [Clostridiales bacterium]